MFAGSKAASRCRFVVVVVSLALAGLTSGVQAQGPDQIQAALDSAYGK